MRRRNRPTPLVPAREPSGRLSRASLRAVDAVSPTEARRLRDAAVRGIRGPEWGTEIGRMYLDGAIDNVAYETGKRWGRLAEAYHRAMGASSLHPRSASLERREPGREPDPDSEEGKKRTAEDRDIIRDMQEAQVILTSAGELAEQAVRSVCEEDKCVVGAEGHKALERGLAWLAEYWGLRRG
jgi:hypothetical protein